MNIEEQSFAEQKYVNLDGLSFEEAEKWSQLLSICKDISDSNIPVGDVKKGTFYGKGDAVISYVDVDFDDYRRSVDNKIVRRNVSIFK